MCGPLAAYACSGRPGPASQVRYQTGRLISFTIVGVIAGAVGGAAAVSLPGVWGGALLSWSLALGLGLAALRLWRRPKEDLVELRNKPHPDSTPPSGGLVAGLGRHPFLVGLGTALLPCGALASAALIAASTGAPGLGALSMLAFAAVSGLGLIGATWVYGRFARRPSPTTAKALAVVLALGAVVFIIRPVHALQHSNHVSHPPTQPGAASPMDHHHEGHP